MASITINIPDEQLWMLQQLAQESHISSEDLLRASIEDWLTCPKNEFAEVVLVNSKAFHFFSKPEAM